MIRRGFFVLCFVLTTTPGLFAEASDFAIVLDGRITDDEWGSAERISLTHGGELLWMRSGTHLYLGLRGTGPGWSHVYVSGGDEIHVLHASAALGAIRYQAHGSGLWQPVNEFNWGLRGDVDSETQGAYLDQHGWVASTLRMGASSEQEYIVELGRLAGSEPRLAVVYVAMQEDGTRASGPGELTDDTLLPDLLNGNATSDVRFDPASWAKVTAPQLEGR